MAINYCVMSSNSLKKRAENSGIEGDGNVHMCAQSLIIHVHWDVMMHFWRAASSHFVLRVITALC